MSTALKSMAGERSYARGGSALAGTAGANHKKNQRQKAIRQAEVRVNLMNHMKEAAGREQDRIDIEHLRMRLEDDDRH